MLPDIFSVENKNILITGSSSGIGLVLATELGRRGARIILNGTNHEKLAGAASRLRSLGITAYTAAFDVTDADSCAQAVQAVLQETGTIDVLINNAGIQKRAPAESFDLSEADAILSVNLKGAFIVSQVVGRIMISRRRGKIINICSVQSELGRPSITPYAASKGGVKMLTKGLAAEWAKYNIQVNGIGPGYFITDMTRPLAENGDFSAWLSQRVPAGRWGDPRELAGAAVFLSSESSDYVNGHILYVDGGMLASV